MSESAESRSGSHEGGVAAAVRFLPGRVVPIVFLSAVLAGCASAGPDPTAPATEPGPGPAADTVEPSGPEEAETRPAVRRPGPRPELPPIPPREGPIRMRVEYPDSLQLVRPDTNFVFGTVGTGDARLWIGGREVTVEPNGAFIAWLPVPEAGGRAGEASYRLVARSTRVDASGKAPEEAGRRDSLVLEHPIRRPEPGFEAPESGVWLDSTSIDLPRLRWALPEEALDFEIRAAPGADVWLEVEERRVQLAASSGSEVHRGSIRAGAVEEAVCPEQGSRCLRWPEAPAVALRFSAAMDGDTVRRSREVRLRVLETDRLPVAELRGAPDPVHGQSGVVVGRPIPYGPYAWRFPDGTRAEVTGRRGERLRLSVPGAAEAWVDVEDALVLSDGAPRPSSLVGRLEVEPRADRVRIRIPLESAVPATVSRPDRRRLVLRLHGARAATERVSYGPSDPLLRAVEWSQEPGPVVRLEFRLSQPVWGYRVRWRAGEPDGEEGPLVLEIRSPPTIDPSSPLRGRTIAVDPGHPGAGAYGPTGYYEGDANLAIAGHLVEMLREEGARPVLIRDDTLQMGLYERTNRATEAGAELFVSIHNNALPDGVYPFGEEGTSAYYYHPHSRELAEAVQAGMLRHMGLRDLGVFWGNLAVTRMSWMPSVLAEGAFMMIPRHEAALKTPEFQRAYARGVLEGLRRFLAARAAEARRSGSRTAGGRQGEREPRREDR